jgi:hypothetical protein
VGKHHAAWISSNSNALRRFPAVLDTGFNDTLLMQEAQFRSWAGLAPRDLEVLDFITVSTHRVPLLDADIWLHPNLSGHRDLFASEPPFRLEVSTGIGVTPATAAAPRLPLLGTLALRRARLHLNIDYEKCHVSLHTPRRLWFFG